MQNKNRETQIEMLGNLRALLYAEDHNGRVVGLDLLCGWVAMLDRLTDGQLAAIAQQDKPLLMNNLRSWLKEDCYIHEMLPLGTSQRSGGAVSFDPIRQSEAAVADSARYKHSGETQRSSPRLAPGSINQSVPPSDLATIGTSLFCPKCKATLVPPSSPSESQTCWNCGALVGKNARIARNFEPIHHPRQRRSKVGFPDCWSGAKNHHKP